MTAIDWSRENPTPITLGGGGAGPERLPSEALQHTFPDSGFAASTAGSMYY